MQKDLKLSLNMGDTLEQPLPIPASPQHGDITQTFNFTFTKIRHFFVIFSLILYRKYSVGGLFSIRLKFFLLILS